MSNIERTVLGSDTINGPFDSKRAIEIISPGKGGCCSLLRARSEYPTARELP